MQTGLVFNLQKYSINDGPGIRTTVFLKGCPLCCAWCHNPEGQSPEREVLTIETRCMACGECRRACPFAESIPGDGPMPSKIQECQLCCECVAACPSDARQVVGREMTVDEVMAEVAQDTVFYDDSSGGVTFSGGEPMMQADFLVALLDACRRTFGGGAMPDRSYRRGMSQCRPEDGQRNEEPVDPRRIVERLERLGFRASARAHFGFGRNPLLPLVNTASARLGTLPLLFAERYLVIGTRR